MLASKKVSRRLTQTISFLVFTFFSIPSYAADVTYSTITISNVGDYLAPTLFEDVSVDWGDGAGTQFYDVSVAWNQSFYSVYGSSGLESNEALIAWSDSTKAWSAINILEVILDSDGYLGLEDNGDVHQAYLAVPYNSSFSAGLWVNEGSVNGTINHAPTSPYSHLGYTVWTEVSPVPLPATGWLLITAIGGLFGVNKWNQRKAAT